MKNVTTKKKLVAPIVHKSGCILQWLEFPLIFEQAYFLYLHCLQKVFISSEPSCGIFRTKIHARKKVDTRSGSQKTARFQKVYDMNSAEICSCVTRSEYFGGKLTTSQ